MKSCRVNKRSAEYGSDRGHWQPDHLHLSSKPLVQHDRPHSDGLAAQPRLAAKALARSDFHYLSEDTFVVLSRDGKGNGNDDNNSKHKDFILFSTSGATDIKDTVYTTTDTAVAPGGVLVSNVTAMVPVEFIDMIDDTQLGKFGFCNNCDYAVNLLNGKWESIAIASIQDPAYPDDYFLFSFSDNDFISLNGIEDGATYVDSFSAEYGYSLGRWSGA